MTSGQLRRRFDRLNRLYWDGELPVPRLTIIPAGQQGVVMVCNDWGGYLKLDGGEHLIELRAMAREVDLTFLNANLLHEMVHMEIGMQHPHRSRRWRQAVRRLGQRGAMIEVL